MGGYSDIKFVLCYILNVVNKNAMTMWIRIYDINIREEVKYKNKKILYADKW